MKKSEEKKKLVEELAQLHKELSVPKLYDFPEHEISKDWIANVSAVLKQLDGSDYQKFQNLQSGLYLSIGDRRYRISTAEEVDRFVRQKVAEYRKYDFSYLDKKEKPLENYWNLVNPLWLTWKFLIFIWNHKLMTAIAATVSLLGIGYSLAWRNTLWIINFIRRIL